MRPKLLYCQGQRAFGSGIQLAMDCWCLWPRDPDITEWQCSSALGVDHWARIPEDWIHIICVPLSVHSLSGSQVPHMKNKRVRWLWGTFLSLCIHGLSQGHCLLDNWQQQEVPKWPWVTNRAFWNRPCQPTQARWAPWGEGGVIFQTHRKQHDGARRTKLPGWNVSSVPTLLCIPTENLTLSSLVTLGFRNKFLHAPWLFPKYVLISDSVEQFFKNSRLFKNFKQKTGTPHFFLYFYVYNRVEDLLGANSTHCTRHSPASGAARFCACEIPI